MPNHILPDDITEQISLMISSGMSTIDIYDRIFDQSALVSESEELVLKLISSIKSKITFNNKNIKPFPERKLVIPSIKKFDTDPHSDIINRLNRVITEKRFESLCKPIVLDILQNNEGFTKAESAENIPGFDKPPFDYLAFKGKTPYLIECKVALNSFNSPGETDKRRIKELMSQIDGLKMAIIQVRVNTGEYRIFFNNETDLFFDRRKVSVAPVIEWIESKMKKPEQV